LVPISVTIAILRHRLYDIDLVLNRTIVFGALAVFITGLYVVVVVGVGTLIGDPSNVALTVGTTALVAAAFEPVRARVQHWANVAIYGRRATPYEVLAAIAADMGSAGGGDGQLEGMAALLADGTGAEHATVWVNVDDGLRATACWPSHDPAEHPALVVAGGDLELPSGAAHIEPVRHDGELLGALSLDRRREDPVTPREQRLVAELAGQASLVLGNARLRARLRARLEELRASRQRLVATQDEARRRLERDLHDGAQQQLVALKVKLGMARTIAEKEGAGEAVTRRLEQLSATADRAVDSLRSLARGIYPPLLEAEGLERAITAQASSAPIDVVVRADGVGRYSRQVEATIYFCVLEALSNTVEHADASSVEIVLKDLGDRLSFRMADDGRGFDPGTTPRGLGLRNMADRIDALGGEFRVEAAPGTGIRLHGTIPDPKRATDATEPVASMA
jgi:signal transduction histidine kinase